MKTLTFGPIELQWRVSKARPPTPKRPKLRFICNICGATASAPTEHFDRETPNCSHCGSNVRFRAFIALLGQALGRGTTPLVDWPVDKAISGVGLSDWPGYAAVLAEKCDYRNTHFHAEPKLDICAPPSDWQERFDFLLSSDVFEHVMPPVQAAFEGSFRLLKPGGLLVMSVPFVPKARTREHYPDAVGYRLDEGGRVLIDSVSRGDYVAAEPVFHGGPGATLEMRLFGGLDLEANLEAAGFEAVRVHAEAILEVGVVHPLLFSLPITARKPR